MLLKKMPDTMGVLGKVRGSAKIQSASQSSAVSAESEATETTGPWLVTMHAFDVSVFAYSDMLAPAHVHDTVSPRLSTAAR